MSSLIVVRAILAATCVATLGLSLWAQLRWMRLPVALRRAVASHHVSSAQLFIAVCVVACGLVVVSFVVQKTEFSIGAMTVVSGHAALVMHARVRLAKTALNLTIHYRGLICPKCLYPRIDSETTRCPECGLALPYEEVRKHWQHVLGDTTLPGGGNLPADSRST